LDGKQVQLTWADAHRETRRLDVGPLTLALSDMPVFLTGDFTTAKPAEAALRIEQPPYPLAPGERAELKIMSPPGGERTVTFSPELPLQLLPPEPGQRDRYGFKVRPDASPTKGSVVVRLFDGKQQELASAGATIEIAQPLSVSLGAPSAAGNGLRLPIRVANTRPVKAEGARLQLEAGPGLRVACRTERVDLRPSQTLTVPARAVPDRPAPGGAWPLTVRLALPSGAEIRETFKLGLWSVPRLKKAPVVDGVDSDWPNIPPAVLGADRGDFFVLREGAWGGPQDLSAKVRLAWDHRALYVLVAVTDDRHVQSHHGPDVWQSDNVQLAFDADLAAWHAREEGKPVAYAEIGLTRTDTGDEVYRWLWREGPVAGVRFKSSREGQITTYEAALPWPELNASAPRPGALSGFALLVNEDDGEGRDGWLQLYDGIGYGKDPRKFGVLRFVG